MSALAFTAEDLVTAANKAGFDGLTIRTLTDWVQKGLLDQPTRHGNGRGQGSNKGTYSQHQRDLLLVLLAKRPGPRGLSNLLNIPISIWLYWGDDYVPTRQALRAMKTWANHYETAPATRAIGGVDGLITQIRHPDATDTALSALRRTLMQAATSRRIPTDLALRIQHVVDPLEEGRTLGIPGVALDADVIVHRWLCDRLVMSKLRAGEVKDSDMEFARTELRESLAEYATAQPWMALAVPIDPFQAIKADPVDMQQLVQNAARHVLMPLAARLEQKP